MDKTNMKSGSIDILVGKDKRYYFLEVNPIGQFYQVSYPCNFYLEKRIAKYFKNGK
jgi:D-alanine-D-alanine ligase-like ATP-grasp enzyme